MWRLPLGRSTSPAIELVECKDVRIEDIKVRNTAGWGIHPLLCERVFVRGISMITSYNGPNTDGIDPDSTRDMMISDSYIETGDDAIVLKTTGRLGRPAPPCENITVTNCVLKSDDAALKLGTESHGDFRRIVFSGCTIQNSNVGVAIYAKDGGTFENVNVSNLTIETLSTHNRVTYPIYIDLERRFGDSRESHVRDITFSDILVHTKGRVLVGGMPQQPLENLTFRNVILRVTGFETVKGLTKHRGSSNVRPAPPEIDYSPVPAALVFANIHGLTLDGIRVLWDTDEAPVERQAIYAAEVQGLTIRGFQGRPAVSGSRLGVIGLDKAKDVFVTASTPTDGTGVFVGFNQMSRGELVLTGNNLRHASQEAAEGATVRSHPLAGRSWVTTMKGKNILDTPYFLMHNRSHARPQNPDGSYQVLFRGRQRA